MARLNKATDKAEAANRVVAAADAILGDVDADAVASYFGRKEPRDGAAAKKRGDDMDEPVSYTHLTLPTILLV